MIKNFYNGIKDSYFEWLCEIINDEKKTVYKYLDLLRMLFETDFTYTIPMDSNREADGIDLRYRFGRDVGYEDYQIGSYLDTFPCSILEMMVSLSIRCENQFAYDPEYGDRTSEWFWTMIKSLGLYNQTDNCFDQSEVELVLDRFLARDFKKNGQGGLFTIHDPSKDMREIDIWYQMCAYLNEVL